MNQYIYIYFAYNALHEFSSKFFFNLRLVHVITIFMYFQFNNCRRASAKALNKWSRCHGVDGEAGETDDEEEERAGSS